MTIALELQKLRLLKNRIEEKKKKEAIQKEIELKVPPKQLDMFSIVEIDPVEMQNGIMNESMAKRSKTTRRARKARHKFDGQQVDFGRGLAEITGCVTYERLSEPKKIGYLAHLHYEKAFMRAARAYIQMEKDSGIPRNVLSKERPDVLEAHLDDWALEWGHVPGWWRPSKYERMYAKKQEALNEKHKSK